MGNPGKLPESAIPSPSASEDKKLKEDGTDKPPKKRGSKAQGRKRTKTGCLTCRKRRIKCGEERPTCQNCTKSKRQCEGYNQRVVFKDPLNAYRPSLSTSSHISFPVPNRGQAVAPNGQPQFTSQQPASGQNPLPIAPKPFGFQVKATDTASMSALPLTSPGLERRVYSFSDETMPASTAAIPISSVQTPSLNKQDIMEQPCIPEQKKSSLSKLQPSHYDFNALVKQERRDDPSSITPTGPPRPLDWPAGPNSGSLSYLQELYYDSDRQFPAVVPFFQSYPASSTWESQSNALASASNSFPAPTPTHTEFRTELETPDRSEGPQQTFQTFAIYRQEEQIRVGNYPPSATNSQMAQLDLPWRQLPDMVEDEDDPFDVSDEDVTMEGYDGPSMWQDDTQDSHLRDNDLGIVVALQANQDNKGVSLRSFTSFIDRPDMLSTYVPSSQSTPLRDPMTARIFCHFVNVTGPSMSMFERHPANPSLMFQGTPVPKSQQHIWAYTFPTLALQNPALLHAMLALASIHIAKLQNGPNVASLKHYAISLRRVAKSVSLHTRRGHPATLAAALLLAFYECWTADHQKWSNHLLGAKQLVREIDFSGMTRYIKKRKARQRRGDRAREYHARISGKNPVVDERDRLQPYVDEVDENIVGIMMGRKVQYDQYGQILDDDKDEGWTREYTERDLEIYETQRDLFWWYCKQDAYQSILGGGRLFMDYSLWSHCPPRAPLGRLNATYGTFDHLVLLLGRLADFAAKDLKRKRLAMKVNGGRWQPPESMRMQSQASQPSHGLPTTPPQQQTQMPGFSGMVPGVQEPKLPMGFEASRDTSPQSTRSDDIDLQAQTQEAEEEWQDIRNAFSVLEDHFGADFQALGPEFSAPIQTPFGTALQYRTYGIAGIWMNYYMALIACHRSHPSMPPAAMMAAGIAARQTAFFATELGRIAAGIAPDCSLAVQVNPGVGAALIESSTGLFLAGVQYQNADQRAWTICRLRDITRLTGWQTALAIASGCEASWVKTGELGNGAPYTRSKEERVVPDIWSNARRIDRAFSGKTNKEKRLVIERSDRVHYALGVLGLQEDFESLDLDNDDRPN